MTRRYRKWWVTRVIDGLLFIAFWSALIVVVHVMSIMLASDGTSVVDYYLDQYAADVVFAAFGIFVVTFFLAGMVSVVAQWVNTNKRRCRL